MPQRLDFQMGAPCQSRQDIFFPVEHGRTAEDIKAAEEAKAICRVSCTVRSQCLRYALENDCYGIWGGTTRRERKSMLSRHKKKGLLSGVG